MADQENLPLPELDDLLQSLLLIEEGEHEFASEDEDVQELRHLFFPVTRRAVYLNHASVGPFPAPVARTLYEYTSDISNFGGMHDSRWNEYYSGTHRRLANMLHGRPDQIALTASTSDSLMHIAQGLDWKEGDTIVTAEGEFPSNVYPWLNLQEQGVRVQVIPACNNRIPTEDIFAALDERTRLVSLSLVEFATGFRNDIASIAEYCHERGIFCGIDAAQALGSVNVDVQLLGVDYIAGVSHKWLLSPQTSGILYLGDPLLERLRANRRSWFSVQKPHELFNYEQPLKAGAARFEYGTPNMMSVVGLDAALGVFECLNMYQVEERILGLAAYAIAGLERLGYPVISPQGEGERSGIVCFLPHPERADLNIQQIADELLARNVYVAVRGSVLRISPHFYNTPGDIDIFLNVLEDLKQKPELEEAK
jgi:cysteine desulfurase/selenocysteine lyase